MIQFGKIIIEYFGSIKYLEYDFGRRGINVITGDNGVGKTTIFNALSWCVYGQLIKPGCSVEPWPHTIDKEYKGTKVTLYLNKLDEHIEIVRCKNYRGKVHKQKGKNGIFVFEGNDLIGKKYKRNIQPHINNWLGYSFNLFKNAILFGQEIERLMKETGPNKRKVFEEAFDTLFIDTAKQKVEGRLNKDQSLLTELSLKREGKEEKLEDWDKNTTQLIAQLDENLEQEYENMKGFASSLIQLRNLKKSSDKAALTTKKLIVEGKIEKYTKKINPKLEDEEFRLSMWINGANATIETLRDEKKQLYLSLNKKNKCSQCGQDLLPKIIKAYKKKINAKIGGIDKQIKEKVEELNTYNPQYEEVKSNIENQQKYKGKLSTLKNQLSEITRTLTRVWAISEKIKLKKEQIEACDKNIQKYKTKQRELKENRDKEERIKIVHDLDKMNQEIKKAKKRVKTDNWLIKDPLSNTGLKAYIFDAQLREINRNLKQYFQDIGFKIKIWVDLESARKDICISIFRQGDEVPYEDLSGGQKQLTDIALSFALNDTITKSRPINILLMDELFERLSDTNTEIVADMVQKRSQTSAIQLITHNSSFNPTGAKKVYLTLSKKGHTTAA